MAAEKARSPGFSRWELHPSSVHVEMTRAGAGRVSCRLKPGLRTGGRRPADSGAAAVPGRLSFHLPERARTHAVPGVFLHAAVGRRGSVLECAQRQLPLSPASTLEAVRGFLVGRPRREGVTPDADGAKEPARYPEVPRPKRQLTLRALQDASRGTEFQWPVRASRPLNPPTRWSSAAFLPVGWLRVPTRW